MDGGKHDYDRELNDFISGPGHIVVAILVIAVIATIGWSLISGLVS